MNESWKYFNEIDATVQKCGYP